MIVGKWQGRDHSFLQTPLPLVTYQKKHLRKTIPNMYSSDLFHKAKIEEFEYVHLVDSL